MVTITDLLGKVFGGGRPSGSTGTTGPKGAGSTAPVLNPLDPHAKNVVIGTINGLNGRTLKIKCLNTKAMVGADGKPVRTWSCAQDGEVIAPPAPVTGFEP